jgi:hypothetical protein
VRYVAHDDEVARQRLLDSLERIRSLVRLGSQHRSRHGVEFFEDKVNAPEVGYPHLVNFAQATHEFAVYIGTDEASLINHGELFLTGKRISSFLAESTVKAVVSKRFAKRQQMQWTKRGAHLLLQTWTRALDGALPPLFVRWYTGLASNNVPADAKAGAA